MKKLIGLIALAFSTAAFAAPQTVTLNWTDAGAEDGYILQRNPAACSAVVSSNWVTVATPGADVTSYVDTVEGDATYCWRVAAVKNSVNQGWSNLFEISVVDTVGVPVLSGAQD